MTRSLELSASRRRLVGVVVWIPTLVAALVITGLEGWRAARPAEFVVAHRASTFADAIAENDARSASEFIWAGEDPNAIIPVHHTTLTAGRVVFVSPLVWAVATHAPRSVLMLLGLGASMKRPSDRMAVCLARQLHDTEIEAVLRVDSATPLPTSCPPGQSGQAPLTAYEIR
jgi:hypothetical protein